jgi:HlyD family secretion protein
MKRKVVWGVVLWKRGPKPTGIQTAQVERQDLQAKVSANGKVQATKKVDISATVPGQVIHLAVREGDFVKKGQFLLQLDAVNYRAGAKSSEFSMQALLQDLDGARLGAEQAQADLERAVKNNVAGILSAADLQRARANASTAQVALLGSEQRVAQARATLEGAQNSVSKTTILAPMDGIVTARRIEEGEVAIIGIQNQPGTVLLTISDMSVVEAEMEIDETSIPSVALGQLQQFQQITGGALGIAFGLGAAFIARAAFQFQAAAPLWSVVLGFCVSSAVGLVFGMWPALKAARQDPIEALRYE